MRVAALRGRTSFVVRVERRRSRMVHGAKQIGRLILCLLAALMLLVCPRLSAAGTWTVISLHDEPGDLYSPRALAADAAGSLYVADGEYDARIERWDAQGNWSILAPAGDA